LLRADRLFCFSEVEDHTGDQGRPAGLMACAKACARVAVEVLVERDKVAPVGVCLHVVVWTDHRAASVGVALEDADEPPGDLVGSLAQCDEVTRANRALSFEVGVVVVVEAPERRISPSKTLPARS
jgi:hypothetical protein